MSRFAAVLFSLALAAVPASAQNAPGADVEFGPAIGETIDFGTLKDQTGAGRELASIAGDNGLVLMFVRSADWCPYCQGQLIDMNMHLGEIESRGYNVASISYDSTDILARFTAREDVGYTMLSDEGSVIINKYGLRETDYPEGHRAYGVPKPIVFILNTEGVIEGKLFEESYRERPPAVAVGEAIDQIEGGG
jgi:peroxiredoxin